MRAVLNGGTLLHPHGVSDPMYHTFLCTCRWRVHVLRMTTTAQFDDDDLAR